MKKAKYPVHSRSHWINLPLYTKLIPFVEENRELFFGRRSPSGYNDYDNCWRNLAFNEGSPDILHAINHNW